VLVVPGKGRPSLVASFDKVVLERERERGGLVGLLERGRRERERERERERWLNCMMSDWEREATSGSSE